jgi:hypothetical protein
MTDLDTLVDQYAAAAARRDQAAMDGAVGQVPDDQLEHFLDRVEPHAPPAPGLRTTESYARGLELAGAGTDAAWLAALASGEDLAAVLARADEELVTAALVSEIQDLQGSEPAVRRYLRRTTQGLHDPGRLHRRVVDALARAIEVPVEVMRALQERSVFAGGAAPAGVFRAAPGHDGDAEFTERARTERDLVDELFDHEP